MVSFSQLPSVKKDIIFGAARKTFLFRDGFRAEILKKKFVAILVDTMTLKGHFETNQ